MLNLPLVMCECVTHIRVGKVRSDTCDSKKEWERHWKIPSRVKETHARVKINEKGTF